MKNAINYYYNLNITEIEKLDKFYRFKINDQTYFLVPAFRDEKELKDILEIIFELKKRNIIVHDIIINIFQKAITNIENKNYCLIKINDELNQIIEINDMLKMNDRLILKGEKSKLYRNMWGDLWSSKIDYFEYQIREIGKDKKIILNSFSYYVGLAENAISYVNNTIKTIMPTAEDKIVLAHKRVGYPNYSFNYFNPLSFVFDLEVRDIGEYLKSAFFENGNAIDILEEVLRIRKYSPYSIRLLYARLLYPSYYFDLYEKIMNEEEKEEALLPILDKLEEYEIFLKDVWFLLNKYAMLDPIDWLLI